MSAKSSPDTKAQTAEQCEPDLRANWLPHDPGHLDSPLDLLGAVETISARTAALGLLLSCHGDLPQYARAAADVILDMGREGERYAAVWSERYYQTKFPDPARDEAAA